MTFLVVRNFSTLVEGCSRRKKREGYIDSGPEEKVRILKRRRS